jgi:hypothetical protein
MPSTSTPTTQRQEHETQTHGANDLTKQHSDQGNRGHEGGQSSGSVAQNAGRRMESMSGGDSRSCHSGMVGSAASTLQGTMDSVGNFFKGEGMQNLMGDVTHFVRRNPIPVVAVGVVVGFLAACALNQMTD